MNERASAPSLRQPPSERNHHMSRLIVLFATTLATSTAFAQSTHIDVSDEADMAIRAPGMKVRVKATHTREFSEGASLSQPPPRVVGVENFDVRFEQMGDQKVRVTSPEGARVDAWSDEGELIGSFTAPCGFQGRPGHFYRVIVSGPEGEVLLDRKVEVKAYYRTIVQTSEALPAPRPPHRHGPPVFSVKQADFPSVLAAVQRESFSDARLDVVRLSTGAFTIEQVGQLVDVLDHSSDKVKMVEVVRNRVVDPQNAFQLLSHFTFEGDKKRIGALFDQAPPEK